MSGEVYGTTRLGACLHAPRVGAVGCDHMTISEFNVGHEAFVPFDKGALYESWPFQSRPKAPSVHNCQDRSFSDAICYNFSAIVDPIGLISWRITPDAYSTSFAVMW